jgi:hypothetical protein
MFVLLASVGGAVVCGVMTTCVVVLNVLVVIESGAGVVVGIPCVVVVLNVLVVIKGGACVVVGIPCVVVVCAGATEVDVVNGMMVVGGGGGGFTTELSFTVTLVVDVVTGVEVLSSFDKLTDIALVKLDTWTGSVVFATSVVGIIMTNVDPTT